MKLPSGTCTQSALRHQPNDYAHMNIPYPVVGIVLEVYMSDDLNNTGSQRQQGKRGHCCEATVRVINDGSDSPWTIPHVVIPPRGSTGLDNFYEELPKPSTNAYDGSTESNDPGLTTREKLNGDRCVVGFIGGSIHNAYMICWWPHEANQYDPTTSNTQNIGALSQGRRLVRRFQGTRMAVTSEGTVMLDTSEANHLIDKGTNRVAHDPGGDIKVTVKNNRELSVNFNPSVFDPNEPDFLWGNSPVKKARETTSTNIRFTKDEISAIAGEVVNIISQRNDIVLSTPQGEIKFGGASADEPMVLGNLWKDLMDDLINEMKTSFTVMTAWGPSGPATAPAQAALDAVAAQFTSVLSAFIFGKKTAG